MSDQEIRRLEREAKDDPEAKAALTRAYVASGRGWSGEQLPHGGTGALSTTEDAGCYLWKTPGGLEVELVRVPAGPFQTWSLAPSLYSPYSSFRVTAETGEFWIGRYPVTWEQWLAWPEGASAPPEHPPWHLGPSAATVTNSLGIPS